jgi:hypothetical protein
MAQCSHSVPPSLSLAAPFLLSLLTSLLLLVVCSLSLAIADLADLEDQDPAAAILLHKIVSRRMGERLILTNELAFNLSN